MTVVHRDAAAMAKNARLYLVANTLGHAYVLLTVPLLSSCLAAADFGIYTLLVQMVSVLQVVGLTMFSQPLFKLCAEYDGAERGDFLGTIVGSVLASEVVLVFLVYGARKRLIPWLYPNMGELSGNTVALACLWAVAASARTLTLTKIKIDERAGLALALNLAYGLSLAVFLGVVLGVRRGGLIEVLGALALAEVTATGVIGLGCWRELRPTWRMDMFLRALRLSVPMAGSSIVFILAANTDRKVLSEYFGLAEMGVYGVGILIGNSLSLATSSYAPAFTSRALKAWKSEGPAAVARLIRDGARDCTVVVGLGWVAILMLGPIGELILNRGCLDGSVCGIAVGVATGHLIRSLYLFAQNLLFVGGRLGVILVLNVALFGLTWGLAHGLVRVWGMVGVAFAMAGAYLFLMPVAFLAGRRLAPVTLPWRWLGRLGLGCLVLAWLQFSADLLWFPSHPLAMVAVRITCQLVVLALVFRGQPLLGRRIAHAGAKCGTGGDV